MIPSFLDYFLECEAQLFRFWSRLTNDQQATLEDQLRRISIATLKKQKRLIQQERASTIDTFDPFDDVIYSGNKENQSLGQQLIREGRLGSLLLAGGQGTRLQCSGPKGAYPISVIKHKSLFQLCAEKVKAASKSAERLLNFAIMTSPENDGETRSFFQQHDLFGLDPSQLSFFVQESLPCLDAEARLMLKTPFEVSCGADGNGHSLLRFAHSGILDRWMQQGIEYLHVIPVDNPLADPFDGELLGFHHREGLEITFACTERFNPEEKVGVLVKQKGSCMIVEYSEMPEKEKNRRRKDGRLKHGYAHLGLFCFSLSFLGHLASTEKSLPLHKGWKTAYFVDDKGRSHLSPEPIAWKFETFIFDWLLQTRQVAALVYPREQRFAPLKNLTGVHSPKTVRESLQESDKKVIQALTGFPPPDFPFELTADFYYPTSALQEKWQGKIVTTSYVEP